MRLLADLLREVDDDRLEALPVGAWLSGLAKCPCEFVLDYAVDPVKLAHLAHNKTGQNTFSPPRRLVWYNPCWRVTTPKAGRYTPVVRA